MALLVLTLNLRASKALAPLLLPTCQTCRCEWSPNAYGVCHAFCAICPASTMPCASVSVSLCIAASTSRAHFHSLLHLRSLVDIAGLFCLCVVVPCCVAETAPHHGRRCLCHDRRHNKLCRSTFQDPATDDGYVTAGFSAACWMTVALLTHRRVCKSFLFATALALSML